MIVRTALNNQALAVLLNMVQSNTIIVIEADRQYLAEFAQRIAELKKMLGHKA